VNYTRPCPEFAPPKDGLYRAFCDRCGFSKLAHDEWENWGPPTPVVAPAYDTLTSHYYYEVTIGDRKLGEVHRTSQKTNPKWAAWSDVRTNETKRCRTRAEAVEWLVTVAQ
jgi:hypothetical protein